MSIPLVAFEIARPANNNLLILLAIRLASNKINPKLMNIQIYALKLPPQDYLISER